MSASAPARASANRIAARWRSRNFSYHGLRRLPARHRWKHEPASGQYATVIGELLFGDPNEAPMTRSNGSRMQLLAWTKGNHFAGPDLDAAPDRRGSSINRKHEKNHAGGHRDESDPRLCLLDGRQPQPLKPDLGHSRLKLPAPGEQHPGDPVSAQSRLKILRFTKYRCAAARHSSPRPDPKP